MAKRKVRSAIQWKVSDVMHVADLQRYLEKLTAGHWEVVSILGPLGALVVVSRRTLVL